MIIITVISVPADDSIIVFRATTFAQNMVQGGSPPRLAVTRADPQNEIVVLLFFFVSILSTLRVVAITVEYSLRNTLSENTEHTPVIISQPLLFKEDTANTLFMEIVLVRLRRGTSTLAIASTLTVADCWNFSLRVSNRMMGMIFCHVITTRSLLSFISIILISFMYHPWVGQAPIFVIRERATKKENLFEKSSSCKDLTSRVAEAIICTSKYRSVGVSCFFHFPISLEIRKHMAMVLISRQIHAEVQFVLHIPIIDELKRTRITPLISLTLKKFCSFKL